MSQPLNLAACRRQTMPTPPDIHIHANVVIVDGAAVERNGGNVNGDATSCGANELIIVVLQLLNVATAFRWT